MIGQLWRGIQLRFETSTACTQYVRKLYRGYDGEREKSVVPYAVVDFIDGATSDTMGADAETCTVRFTIHTKREIADLPEQAFEAMLACFDDCELHLPEWGTATFQRIGWSGPRVEDAQNVVEMSYEVELVRQYMLPPERGV